MICLTGDVHHMSLHTSDQEHLDCTEVEAAIKYAKIASKVKVTLFITGKAVKEESQHVRKLLELPNVELGGHNYYGFRPKWLYNGIFRRIFDLPNGPATYQNYEIRKTIRIFQKMLDLNIVSWRDHAYRHDKNTYDLLAQNDIACVSDEVSPDKLKPYPVNGLTSIPINVLPDHDHMYHANITPETTKNWSLNRDKFPPNLYSIMQWERIIKNQVEEIVENDGCASMLIHPACMKIADGFNTFRKLCNFLSNYDSMFVKDLMDIPKEGYK